MPTRLSQLCSLLCAICFICANSRGQDLDYYVEELRLEQDAVKDSVLTAIAAFGNEDALQALVRGHGYLINPRNQARIIEAFTGFLGSEVEVEALEQLTDWTEHDNFTIAEAAVHTLGLFRAPGMRALESCVKRSSSDRLRAVAVGELLRLWAGPLNAERLAVLMQHARSPESGPRSYLVRHLSGTPQRVALQEYPKHFADRGIPVANRELLLRDLVRRPESIAAPALAELLEHADDEELEARALDLMLGRDIPAPLDWLQHQSRSARLDELRYLASLMRHRQEAGNSVWLGQLQSFARSSEPIEQRIAAKLVMALNKEERIALLEVILRRATDFGVRAEALRAAVGVREPGLIDAILDSLDDPNPRYVKRAVVALTDLTRKTFGSDPSAWRAWWSEVRDGYMLPPPGGNSGRTLFHRSFDLLSLGLDFESRPEDSFFGLQLDSDHIVFVLDTSIEMARIVPLKLGDEIVRVSLHEVVARHLEAVLADLGSRVRFSVVMFGENDRVWKPKLVSANKANINKALKGYRGTILEGKGDVYQALRYGFDFEKADTVVVVSASHIRDSSVRYPQEVVSDLRHWNRFRDLSFHTVSLFGESDLLRSIAAETASRSVFVK